MYRVGLWIYQVEYGDHLARVIVNIDTLLHTLHCYHSSSTSQCVLFSNEDQMETPTLFSSWERRCCFTFDSFGEFAMLSNPCWLLSWWFYDTVNTSKSSSANADHR